MRTLNVLIVDDEPFVVDWLISILDAERSLSLNLFSCHGVTEARDIIRENRIDILLTDIRMPDGSGLDLAEEIHSHWSDCKVIMLTAYSEFEYARRALQSGADSYILKAEKDDYILSEVHRVVDELERTLDERQQKLSIQRDLDRYRHSYRNEVFFHLLHGHYTAKRQMERCAADMELVPSLPIHLVLGRIHTPEGVAFSDINALHVRLSGMCMLNESVQYVFAAPNACDVCFLIQPKADYVQNYQGQLESLFEIVSSSCGNLYGFSVSFALSSALEDVGAIPGTFAELSEVLKNVSADSFVYRLPRTSVSPGPQTDSKQFLVDQINAYIRDNASHDISLMDISQYLSYNSGYLSRLYSAETGVTIKAAIIKRRLAYIEQLMRNEALSLNEILEQSGFKSRSYFNFFIKHTMGMTPSQYRCFLLGESDERPEDVRLSD